MKDAGRQVNIMIFKKTEILGSDFDLKFDQTLAPGPSLSNRLKIKLELQSKSSTIVESTVKFIWQHNLPMEFYSTFKMPSRRMNFWWDRP